jgi:5-methyltetrahydrofolate--homocysteine methyltransferase
MTSAIMNPLRPAEIEAVRAANVLMGTDRDCTTWIRSYRDYAPSAPASGSGSGDSGQAAAEAVAQAGGRRRGGRDARRGVTG